MNLPAQRLRLRAIFCSVLTREISYCIARSRNIVEPCPLPSGLHNLGAERMSATLQETIDRLDDGKADALVLGFGLCNNGLHGLRPRSRPLVVPRAHDCITLLLGSKERYRQVFDAEPGTYYFSPGWLESPPEYHLQEPEEGRSQLGLAGLSYEALIAKYGEDNARYLMETLGGGTARYTRYAWVASELGPFPDYVRSVRDRAEKEGKRFEILQGALSLLQRALDGDWNGEDFVVCRPGQRLIARPADSIIGVEPATNDKR